MNRIMRLPDDVDGKHGITLILTKDEARRQVTELIAGLILRGPLFSISASEWFPSFILPRIIRRQGAEAGSVTRRLRLARASTCHRLLDILANLPSGRETILVIDVLDNFYNPDVPLSTRFFELRKCCHHLKQSSFSRPIIIALQETFTEDYQRLSPILNGIVDRTLHLEQEATPGPATQSALF